MCIYINIFMFIYIYIHIYTYLYIYMYIYLYIYIYVYIYMYTCICTNVCVDIYVNRYVSHCYIFMRFKGVSVLDLDWLFNDCLCGVCGWLNGWQWLLDLVSNQSERNSVWHKGGGEKENQLSVIEPGLLSTRCRGGAWRVLLRVSEQTWALTLVLCWRDGTSVLPGNTLWEYWSIVIRNHVDLDA